MPIATPVAIGTAFTPSGTTAAITTTATVPANSTVFVGFAFYDAAAPTTPSVVGGGLTWKQDVLAKPNTDARYTVIIFSANAPAGLASGSTITPTTSATVVAFGASAAYGQGLAANDVVDVSGGGSNTSATASVSLLPATNPDDLILMFAATDFATSAAHTPAANYLELSDFFNASDGWAYSLVYRIVSTPGSWTPSTTNGSGSPSVAAAVAYRAPDVSTANIQQAARNYGRA